MRLRGVAQTRLHARGLQPCTIIVIYTRALRFQFFFFVSGVWRKLGYTPEGFNLAEGRINQGQKSYPLRPELIESTMYLWQVGDSASRDIHTYIHSSSRALCTCGRFVTLCLRCLVCVCVCVCVCIGDGRSAPSPTLSPTDPVPRAY